MVRSQRRIATRLALPVWQSTIVLIAKLMENLLGIDAVVDQVLESRLSCQAIVDLHIVACIPKFT